MGAASVCGFDCDQGKRREYNKIAFWVLSWNFLCAPLLRYPSVLDALDTAWVNLHKMEITNVDLINIDIQSLKLSHGRSNCTILSLWHLHVKPHGMIFPNLSSSTILVELSLSVTCLPFLRVTNIGWHIATINYPLQVSTRFWWILRSALGTQGSTLNSWTSPWRTLGQYTRSTKPARERLVYCDPSYREL